MGDFSETSFHLHDDFRPHLMIPGEEDEPPSIDMLPDSSTSSRRAPTLRFRDVISEPNIHIHPHSGCIAVSGSYVIVRHSHHIMVYDLALSDVPILNLDTRDMKPK
jgi:hypothetical protein